MAIVAGKYFRRMYP